MNMVEGVMVTFWSQLLKTTNQFVIDSPFHFPLRFGYFRISSSIHIQVVIP